MNIFIHELNAYRRSANVWTFSLILILVLFMSIFPALDQDTGAFKKLLESYPEGVRKAFRVSIGSITSLLGYYSYALAYIVLCGSIQAMNLGISILSKETREKTSDFLLSKPVTRKQIMTAKLMSAVVSLAITNAIYLAAAFVTLSAVSRQTVDIKRFFLISLTAFWVELMFMAVGILFSMLMPKLKQVLPISLGTVFAFYILNMLGAIVGGKTIRYLTPFNYYDTAYIIRHGSYETSFILIEILLITAAIAASFYLYSKKDIHAV